MAMLIHQFQQKAEDLECGHSVRWAGALEGSAGEHVIALDCAKCVSSQKARDTLREFALYVHLASFAGKGEPAVAETPKVMKAY